MRRIYLGTRKGLFVASVQSDGSVSAPRLLAFAGAPVSMLLANELDHTLYVALNHGHFGVKLHRSMDEGASWHECSVPAYPQESDADQKASAAALSEIWSLEHGGKDHPEVLWCGTIPGGLFRSVDRGDSWQLIESLWNRPERKEWFGGGKDHPGIHSVCVDPRDGNRIVVGISCGGVWRSRDAGASWELKAAGMRAEFMPPERQFDGNIQDPHRVVQCRDNPDVFWAQHHNGIFHSSDGCESWTEVSNGAMSTFGFAVVTDPCDGRKAWFVPAVKDECRIPVDGRFVVTHTSDGGRSFSTITTGLPDTQAWDLVYRHALAINESGTLLVMGSTTGSLWVSTNAGAAWKHVSAHLPLIYCVSTGFADQPS